MSGVLVNVTQERKCRLNVSWKKKIIVPCSFSIHLSISISLSLSICPSTFALLLVRCLLFSQAFKGVSDCYLPTKKKEEKKSFLFLFFIFYLYNTYFLYLFRWWWLCFLSSLFLSHFIPTHNPSLSLPIYTPKDQVSIYKRKTIEFFSLFVYLSASTPLYTCLHLCCCPLLIIHVFCCFVYIDIIVPPFSNIYTLPI